MTGTPSFPLRIGTRGSALALWQAGAVREALLAAHGWPETAVEIVVIRTTGDRITDRALLEAGGKGLFTKEIEDQLLSGDIRMAVHSAKDMPTRIPDGLTLAAYLPRADPRDALVSGNGSGLEALPKGARVGTASLRRAALVRRRRPDLQTALIRGNVPTRIGKVEDGSFDATLLAVAGLNRLGLEARITEMLDVKRFPPACGQGAVAIECRADDEAILSVLAAIDDRPTHLAVTCERAFLDVLDGSCRTPIAGLATVNGSELAFSGLVLSPEGDESYDGAGAGPESDADAIGRRAGMEVKAAMPPEFRERLGL